MAITDEEIQAIVGGYHGDPFAALGPHAKSPTSKHDFEIRAFLPQAQKVEVLMGDKAIPMDRTHPAGFFIASLNSAPERYKLRITDYGDAVAEAEDVYRFPPILSEFDLHLHSEGTNFEEYHAFGAHPTTVEGIAGTRFAVWAPNALVVSVVGDFNDWDSAAIRCGIGRAASGRSSFRVSARAPHTNTRSNPGFAATTS